MIKRSIVLIFVTTTVTIDRLAIWIDEVVYAGVTYIFMTMLLSVTNVYYLL